MKKFLLTEFNHSAKTKALFNLYPFLKENPPEHFIERFLFCRTEEVNDDASFYDSIATMLNEEVPMDFLDLHERLVISETYLEDIKYFCSLNPVVLALGRYFWWDANNTPQGLLITIAPEYESEIFDFDQSSPIGIKYA